MSLLASIEDSAVGVWIRESEWGYPIVLIGHTLGMACLVGVVSALALRVLLAKTPTASAWFDPWFRIAWLGFAINLMSGLVLFSGSPQRFLSNPAFLSKLAALALGALLHWQLLRRMERDIESAPSIAARSIAAGSLLLWFTAIGAGRLIAYLR